MTTGRVENVRPRRVSAGRRPVAPRSPATRVVPFVKWEGGGNDFVLLDHRSLPSAGGAPRLSAARIRTWLDRHRGVGGDGLLVIARTGPGRAARVSFWNPDGRRAAFCGNGARCVAAYLLAGDPATDAATSFRFGRVRLRAARSAPGRYRVELPPPRPLSRPRGRPPLRGAAAGVWIDTGVPHWVVPVRDRAALESLDLATLAPPLRRWSLLGPGGTNVDFAACSGNEIRLRTWERGVEGETLACGSGLAAVGVWAVESGRARYPVRLRSRAGDRFRLERDASGRLWLEGPAHPVFEGRITIGRPLAPGRGLR